MRQCDTKPDELDSSPVYRLVVGVTMLPLFLLFASGFYFRFAQNWKMPDESATPVLDRIAETISWEAHVAFFLFSLIAVIWAVAAPKWITRVMDKTADKALTLTFWLILVSVIYSWRQ